VEEIWDGFRDELRAGPNADLCLRITDYLQQNAAELNSYETTRFLCLKCSCEMGLQRWEEAVRTADAC
jgi:hypothetical protein